MTNKDYKKDFHKLIHGMIRMGYFQNACMLGKLIESRDTDTVYVLSKKFSRIFSNDELDYMAQTVRNITSNFIPESIRGSEAAEAEFICGGYQNIQPLYNHRRS